MNEFRNQLRPILTTDQRVRVFISSTIEELAPERLALRRLIQDELRLHPIYFEAGARPYPPRETYRASLEQSHIFVAVYWKSYGWIAPDMDISGIEDEFNLSARKQRLVYIKDAPEGRDPKLEQLITRMKAQSVFCYARFSSVDELVTLVRDDLMQLLSERFLLGAVSVESRFPLPTYLDDLLEEMGSRTLISRETSIQEIIRMSRSQRILGIFGDPGIGKTFILGQVGERLEGIYVSARGKTSHQVCSHIANHLAVRRGRPPERIQSEDEALLILQEELANASSTILLDDADQNGQVVSALMSLDYYDCRLILASRVPDLFQLHSVPIVQVRPLNQAEVNEFLARNEIVLTPGDSISLFHASEGNPLYLFYFAQHQVRPLPDGLRDYQSALWQRLTPIQKEAVTLVAFSRAPLSVEDLHRFLHESTQAGNLMETKSILDSLIPILRWCGTVYEVFHPYFQEFVVQDTLDSGMGAHYHSTLGALAVERGWIVPAAFHLLRANDPSARQYAIEAASAAILQGEWLLAQEFLEYELPFTVTDSDRRSEAYIHFLMSQVHRDAGRLTESRQEAEHALSLFRETGDVQWQKAVEDWFNVLLIQEGRVEEAIDKLKETLEQQSAEEGQDGFVRAINLLNLSYGLIRISRFEEAADAAEKALDLFKKLNISHGIHASLTNLAGSVGQLGNHELQRKFAEQIIQAADGEGSLRLKASGMNHRGIALRHMNDLQGSQRSFEDAIAICRQVGAVEAEIQNLGNLGNVLRDQQLYNQAEDAYAESLIKAQEHQYRHDEAFALELIGRIKADKGSLGDAISYMRQAIELHQSLGDRLRTGEALDMLGDYLAEEGSYADAATSYNEAAGFLLLSAMLQPASGSYIKATAYWRTAGDLVRAEANLAEGVRVTLESRDMSGICNALDTMSNSKTEVELTRVFLDVLEKCLESSVEISLVPFVYSLSSFCQVHPRFDVVSLYQTVSERIIEAAIEHVRRHELTALAVILEQWNATAVPFDFDSFNARIVNGIEHLHYRWMTDDLDIWTFGADWGTPFVLQLIGDSEYPIVRRIALAALLTLIAGRDQIGQAIIQWGGLQEENLQIHFFKEDALELQNLRHDGFDDFNSEVSASITQSAVPWGEEQPPVYVILHDAYETMQTHSRPNMAFIWLVANLYKSLLTHCIHQHADDEPDLSRMSMEFCSVLDL